MAKKDPDYLPEEIGNEHSKPSSRAVSVLQKIIRWIIVLLLVFVLGFLLVWVVYVGPRAAEISAWQDKATDSQKQIETLQAQVADLQNAQAHRLILSVLVDVNSARFELASQRMSGAAGSLANTKNTLSELRGQLGSDYSAALDSLEERLALALKDIGENDSFAALNDLEVLANSLLNLERGLPK